MALILSTEEQLLADTVRGLADRLVKERPDTRRTWKEMGALGLTGVSLPEAYGGSGLGLPAAAIIMEGLGRLLITTPFLSTSMLAAQALLLGGQAHQRDHWLPRVATGDAILSAALREPASRFDIGRVTTRAVSIGDRFVLSGEKINALEGDDCDALLVSARLDGDAGDETGVCLFVVPRLASGLSVDRQELLDGRAAARVRLENVELDADCLVGRPGEGVALLKHVIDRASVALCGEMVGGMQRAFDLTMDYLKEREQFGRKIGTFQALQHRAARMYAMLALARPSARAAAFAACAEDPDFAKWTAHANAVCADAYLHIASEAIQLHGGIGMTAAFPIGGYLKAAKVAEMLFGDANWHRARWATLSGY